MQALSPTEESVKQPTSTTLTWKEPVELSSSLRGPNGVGGSPSAGPAGDLLGMTARNGPPFNAQQPLGSMNSFRPQNGHQDVGSSFIDPSRQNGIPESVMVMPLIDSQLSNSISSTSSPPSSRKAVRSRARPRKPEEPVPFLSVDTLPADKIVTEGKPHANKQLSKKQSKSIPKRISPDNIPLASGRRSQTPNHPPFSPYGGGKSTPRVPSRAGSSHQNYNSFFTHKNSAFLAGPPSLWSLGNRFWPHQATPNEGRRRLAPIQAPMPLDPSSLKSNYHVSQPFKHNVDNSTPVERPVSPGQELKESTMLALHEVTQQLARQRDPPTSRKSGRLLKGKLKPLHTYQMDGPRMDECQGIQTEENRGQTADKARLLQRKKELLSMLPPDVFSKSAPGSTLPTRPQTEASIHRTSIVSAMSLDRDFPGPHPMQQGQLRSQSMVEGIPPAGPFTSMVTVIDDSVVNQVDIPAMEGQENHNPEGKILEVADQANKKEEDGTLPDPEHLMAGVDADKLSDAVSDNMSDYLSELEGGRAEILCNMVKKNSQARNDLTQMDDEPSDATELENGYDDDYPLDGVQKKDSQLDAVVIDGVKASSTKETTGSATESQSHMKHGDINSNSVGLAHESIDGDKAKRGFHEQRDSPSISKDSIPQSPPSSPSENSMQIIKNNQNSILVEEHLEQSVMSNAESEVPVKTIIEDQANILPGDGISNLSVGNNATMQNALEDASQAKGTKPEGTDSTNDSNINNVPVLNEPQTQNIVPSISVDGEKDLPAVDEDVANNNVQEVPTRTGSTKKASSPADDSEIKDHVLMTDSNAIAKVIEDDVSTESRHLEQKTTPVIQVGELSKFQDGTEALGNITSNVDKANGSFRDADSSNVSENCEEHVGKKISDDVLSSAMNDESGKEEERKGEEEKDDDAEDTKDNDSDDKDTSGGDGGSGSSSSSGGGGGDGGSQSGQGGNNNDSNGGGGDNHSREGGGSSEGGDGGGNDKDKNSGSNQNGNGNNPNDDEESENDEEDDGICFKSLEQLLQEIKAQDSFSKEELVSYDDIPEVDDPVLYCGNCGLDEDNCVCPNSSLHRLLMEEEDNLHIQPQLDDEELVEESSQQENIVLEYKILLGDPPPGSGCYSDDLVSPREVWTEDEHTSKRSTARPSSGPSGDMMLATGTAMTPAQRPVSGKFRPLSTKLSRPNSHWGTKRGGGGETKEDADILSDSGCGSEISEAIIQANQLRHDVDDNLELKTQQEQHATEITEESKSANLAIVASSKPRHSKHKTDDALSLAPFPPLCFKINARPPPGKLYYFAYGPTMNPARLSTYIGSEVKQRLWGILFGFALKFNKKGEDLEAGGFANIEFAPESSVEGCVYCLDPSQLESLDKFMGCPEFYTKIALPVWMTNCRDHSGFGVAQYCIPAVMYIAQNKWTHSDESAPLASGYSIRQCMTGADLLSPAYKQHIQTLVC